MSASAPDTAFGLLAEFSSPQALVDGVTRLQELGYRKVETYAPYPVEGLTQALRFSPRAVSLIFLVATVSSAIAGYAMQYYASVISYPLNIGGRPLHSWPSFIPITFEIAILGGVLIGVFGMLVLNRLPMYSHPVSNVPRFLHASKDAFFVVVETSDPIFDSEGTRAALMKAGASNVVAIPR